jgi:hypothetical protein
MSEFPTHPNREFSVALQGIVSGDHGIFWPDQGRGVKPAAIAALGFLAADHSRTLGPAYLSDRARGANRIGTH